MNFQDNRKHMLNRITEWLNIYVENIRTNYTYCNCVYFEDKNKGLIDKNWGLDYNYWGLEVRIYGL